LSTAPLLVFGEAERLSDAQLDAICNKLVKEKTKAAAALVSGPSFLVRLEALKPGVANDSLSAYFRLQELGPEEIETFVRRQLRSDAEASAFTAEAIGAIADFSGGDPALVNRLARLMLDLADDTNTKRKEKISGNGNPAKASAAEIAQNGERRGTNVGTTPDPALRAIEPNTGALPDLGAMHITRGNGASPAHTRPEREASIPQNTRRAFRMLPIAIVGCLGVGGAAIYNSFGISQLV
jgi:hypothetical protein